MNITMTNVESDLDAKSGAASSYIKPYMPPRVHESPRSRIQSATVRPAKEQQSASKLPSKSYREDEDNDTPESTPRSAIKRMI